MDKSLQIGNVVSWLVGFLFLALFIIWSALGVAELDDKIELMLLDF